MRFDWALHSLDGGAREQNRHQPQKNFRCPGALSGGGKGQLFKTETNNATIVYFLFVKEFEGLSFKIEGI